MLICSGGMDPWILFCAGEWVAMFDCLVWIFRRGLGFQAVLNYCQHIIYRNSYLYLSFAFVNNIVHTTSLHWTQIIAINATSKNTDKHGLLLTNFILVIFLYFFFLILFLQNYWGGNYRPSLYETYIKKNIKKNVTQYSKAINCLKVCT